VCSDHGLDGDGAGLLGFQIIQVNVRIGRDGVFQSSFLAAGICDGFGVRTPRKLFEATDILAGEPYESPMKPFGGIEQLTWSPDSKSIAYTCRKKTGLEYAISTDSDIYLYNLETKQTRTIPIQSVV
jgi:hypothetical protein